MEIDLTGLVPPERVEAAEKPADGRSARFVVEPLTANDVVEAVRFARKNGLTVSTRGAAHSQSRLAVSDGGILLSMGKLDRIRDLDEKAATADVDAGVVWRDLPWRPTRSLPALTPTPRCKCRPPGKSLRSSSSGSWKAAWRSCCCESLETWKIQTPPAGNG